jgi:hypothetical protein
MLCVCLSAAGPVTCDNPPNNLPGYTWTNCNSGTAAVLSTCNGDCDTSAGYTAAGSNPITATCNSKGVYNVTGQCTASPGSRECLVLRLDAAMHCSPCISYLCMKHTLALHWMLVIVLFGYILQRPCPAQGTLCDPWVSVTGQAGTIHCQQHSSF